MKFLPGLITLLLTGSVYAKDHIYVAYFSTVGLEKNSGVSAAFIFSDQVNRYGAYQVVTPQLRDSVYQIESLNEARETAELLSTAYFVIGRLVKLQSVFEVSVTMYAVSSGIPIWNGFETTEDSKDLPILLDKIAARLGTEKKMSQKGDVFRVSRYEARKIHRSKSALSLGISVGGLMSVSDKTNYKESNYTVAPGFGLAFSSDVKNFILQVGCDHYELKKVVAQGFTEVRNTYNNLHIDVLYPLSSTNNAPFVSLGTGYNVKRSAYNYYNYPDPKINYYQAGKQKLSSLMFTGGGGYILRRNATTSLFIYGRGFCLINNDFTCEYGALLNFTLFFGRR